MSSQQRPLHLYEVLEEEYVSLYGPSGEAGRATQTILLPDDLKEGGWREVEATHDWSFRRGHIRDAAGLAADLLNRAEPPDHGGARAHAQPPSDWVRKNLHGYVCDKISDGANGYVRDKISDDALQAIVDWGRQARPGEEPEEALVQPLLDRLNTLLADPQLYDSDRFDQGWLGVASRGLAAGCDPKRHKSGAPKAEAEEQDGGAAVAAVAVAEAALAGDLAHFNRMLLEDAFPDRLERIHNIRLAAAYQRLHQRRPAALSLSGGGIRSGTLALGVIQGLARLKIVKAFDYLSTVSGGGYIGGWLSAWLHRHPEGLEGVARDLDNSAPSSKVDPDPAPLRYLRANSNFITPKVGLLTADTWTFIGIYLRNLLLNWAVFIPLLLAALMVPRLLVAVTLLQPVDGPVPLTIESPALAHRTPAEQAALMQQVPARERVWYPPTPLARDFFDVPVLRGLFDQDKNLYLRHLLLFAGFWLGVWGLAYVNFNRPNHRETLRARRRFWRERMDQSHFLRWCLLPLVLSAFLVTLYWAWKGEAAGGGEVFVGFLIFGVLFTFCAWLVASIVLKRTRAEWSWTELFAILCAGLAGGFIFYLASRLPIGNPVVGYGPRLDPDAGVAGFFPWTDYLRWNWASWVTELYVCVAVPVFLLVFWIGAALFTGLSSFSRKFSDDDREWWARLGGWILIVVIAWVVVNALVIYGPLALLEFPRLLTSIGGVAGLIALLVGRSSKTPGGPASEGGAQTKKGAAAGLTGSLLPLIGFVFLAFVVALLSLATTELLRGAALLARDGGAPGAVSGLITNVPDDGTGGPAQGFADHVRYVEAKELTLTPTPTPTPVAAPTPVLVYLQKDGEKGEEIREALGAASQPAAVDSYTRSKIAHYNVLHHTWLWFLLLVAALLAFVGWLLSRLINLNIFSLHGGYRNRLIRGFLGASRPPGERKPNPFTGFDPADDLHMHELRPALFDEADLVKPSELAAALVGASGARPESSLSQFLLGRERLENVRERFEAKASPGLVEAMRTDLNGVVQQERLYADPGLREKYLGGPRAALVEQAALRALGGRPLDELPKEGDYHILLNRLVLEAAYPGMIRPGQLPPPPYRLLHVVNTTLNLVGGDNLAWQERKAEPFSVSPLHSGCFRLGYRRSREYGGKEAGGITMGTAVAISGAAASSNMGYYNSSPVIALILTLFNVRLGWWLGNPGPAGGETYTLDSPKSSAKPVIYEAFGLTDDRHEYVYLTDGGHFENLAVYEMVLRRCHFIVAVDGAQDDRYHFNDLANAVRKIRIDLGVHIEFPFVPIYAEPPEGGKGQGLYWAIGRINYSQVDRLRREDGTEQAAPNGVLLYIKPAVYGRREPRDVIQYKKSFPAFPNQSTGDQFFDEPQFESYRALGSYIIRSMWEPDYEDEKEKQSLEGADPALRLEALLRRAFKKLKQEGREGVNGKIPMDFEKWFDSLFRRP